VTTDTSGPVRVADVEVNEVADGLLLYRGGDDTVHHLNPLATLVYELCDGRPRPDLVGDVATILAVDPVDAAAIVAAALTELTRLQLVSQPDG
jgi:hypothetical protein